MRDSQWVLRRVVDVCLLDCCVFFLTGGHGRRLGARAFGSRRARDGNLQRGLDDYVVIASKDVLMVHYLTLFSILYASQAQNALR